VSAARTGQQARDRSLPLRSKRGRGGVLVRSTRTTFTLLATSSPVGFARCRTR